MQTSEKTRKTPQHSHLKFELPEIAPFYAFYPAIVHAKTMIPFSCFILTPGLKINWLKTESAFRNGTNPVEKAGRPDTGLPTARSAGNQQAGSA